MFSRFLCFFFVCFLLAFCFCFSFSLLFCFLFSFNCFLFLVFSFRIVVIVLRFYFPGFLYYVAAVLIFLPFFYISFTGTLSFFFCIPFYASTSFYCLLISFPSRMELNTALLSFSFPFLFTVFFSVFFPHFSFSSGCFFFLSQCFSFSTFPFTSCQVFFSYCCLEKSFSCEGKRVFGTSPGERRGGKRGEWSERKREGGRGRK